MLCLSLCFSAKKSMRQYSRFPVNTFFLNCIIYILCYRCHYYDDEENIGCTLGDWHPLAAEKLLVLKMHTGTDEQLYHRGILTIPGFKSCPNSH